MATHLLASSKNGIRASQIARNLGVIYKTVSFLCYRIREAMDGATGNGPIGGPNTAVEADETYVGGKVKNRTTRRAPESRYRPRFKSST